MYARLCTYRDWMYYGSLYGRGILMDDKEKIEKAVQNLVDSWDLETLMNFALEDREHYYLDRADKEEVEWLLEEFGD